MRKFYVAMAGVALVGLTAVGTPAQKTSVPITVMLLDGESAGPYHNWRLTTPVMKKELEETGLFAVTVVTAPDSRRAIQQVQSGFRKVQGRGVELRCAGVARGAEDAV